ncbi:MAG: putative fatty-acid--CoA ligase [Frankiales bacterium]|nr:putative fatty-acid--CoA ligase [Frankiales bacterium]
MRLHSEWVHTFASPLQRAAAVAGTRTAVVCGTTTVTYAETADRCARLAGALRDLGLGKGDRVAVVAANCHRYLELYQAAPASGLVLVPLNTRHAEPELRYALIDSGARALVTDRDPGGLADNVEHVIRIDRGEYDDLVERADPVVLGEGVTEDDLAGLFYTGGTTGAAKGVMLTHRNLVANTIHGLVAIGLQPEDRWLAMAPMFHAAGTFAALATVWLGGTHVVLPVFDPARALDLLEAERCTATIAVPAMLAALNEEQRIRPRDTSSLRVLTHGAAPVATEVLRRAHQLFPTAELVHLYGATETAPLVTASRHEQDLLDLPQGRSCGQPLIGVEVAVLDPLGQPVPHGEVGEVAVRGPNVMQGYWNKPEETARALVDGWYLSGDLGRLDEQGYLYLVDRAKDMVVTGGENVYCTEVEEALYAHPAVLEAAVFGVPDEQWGEAVYAVVVLRSEVTAEELIAHCRTLIAGYKVPKGIDVSAAPLPKSGAGKVLKRELREPFWKGRDGRIA